MSKANEALDKKAENARELGLDYEPVWNNLPSNKDVEDAMRLKRLSRLAEQPAQQEPVVWKLVPVEPTKEMLKAMDECSTEGYDERLYAGHAASVYMAAVDVAPTPPPVAEPHKRKPLTDEWLPVTQNLLNEQHPWLYQPMWIAMKGGVVVQGYYEWRQGRNPDRFITDLGDEWAFNADFVMPITKPTPPAIEAAHGIKENT